MFDQLSENLQKVFGGFTGKTQITEENIESAIREVRRALIEADVSLKAIKTFTTRIREKVIGIAVLKGISPREQFIKIINDEIIHLLGNENNELNLDSNPSIILMLGLQGAGKTTTCAKLAHFLKKKGKNPLLVPLDLKRPAAIEQLKILGEQIGVTVYNMPPNVETPHGASLFARNAVDRAKQNNHDIVILDSAGRLQIDTELMAELLLVEQFTSPQEKLLVIDSMVGQEAANITATFNTQIGLTGIILTKLDGDSRGGAALSVVEETNLPIKLIGAGEKIEDLQEFYPDRVASRILGMGDVLTLAEQAQEKIQEDEAKELEKQLLSDFNFDSFLKMQNTVGKLGNFSNVFNMMGMGNMFNQLGMNLDKQTQEKILSQGEQKLKKFKAAIQSMTKEERVKPNLLSQSRKARISRGSGLKMKDIDQLETEFRQMKKVMDKMKPLLGMLQGQSANQEDLLKSILPKGVSGGNFKPPGNLMKGFKPKKK